MKQSSTVQNLAFLITTWYFGRFLLHKIQYAWEPFHLRHTPKQRTSLVYLQHGFTNQHTWANINPVQAVQRWEARWITSDYDQSRTLTVYVSNSLQLYIIINTDSYLWLSYSGTTFLLRSLTSLMAVTWSQNHTMFLANIFYCSLNFVLLLLIAIFMPLPWLGRGIRCYQCPSVRILRTYVCPNDVRSLNQNETLSQCLVP